MLPMVRPGSNFLGQHPNQLGLRLRRIVFLTGAFFVLLVLTTVMCKYVRVREQFSNVREASSTTADMTVVAVANDSNVNSLAFVPVTLSFRDLYYTIDVGTRKNKTTRQLLKGIHGCFQPGMLTALMGSTGAGKTTLMDVIAGRKTASVIEGDMFVNGHPLVRQTFNSVFGYCEQTDMHEGTATIREAFLFSASLRLPSYTTEFIITLTVTRRFWPPLTPRIMSSPMIVDAVTSTAALCICIGVGMMVQPAYEFLGRLHILEDRSIFFKDRGSLRIALIRKIMISLCFTQWLLPLSYRIVSALDHRHPKTHQ
ncbi:hypothetical protein H310_02393 [Aphanomyces invadans]|uniref:ABC transporter domain-containing protein n=1 Tax=Aphanomyces invadans TaxID=157072 RepID=A0A024UPB2_9STRA|nr:hypothetical protein H310_02393 [Aphanomyces invadans]ETW08015.1 hypothetical protein H310_02393 [Aphanomyces invadans]|eukprot:XP_008864108.1 hypothetical protein H310_02393 [Aphanomyces invadans]